ncbi:hypothetical protein AWB76_02840 [Caballeronia temeraria]|uniref:Cellulose biosynthesis protein BcsR n=1 Tax=Caballeronia temeraria TaxID=1777137 RepID=A0A158AQV6_9BURK|nr:BcsR/BcsP family cellulose biosynthesis protein [Caballeronia temeraria]SAK60089.1 hypothetical protein AWB76_02840 [Caballeronia temeraria]
MKTLTKDGQDRHDVAALAQRVAGLDAARYFDADADEELRVAVTRWPVLARLMMLALANIDAPPGDDRRKAEISA